MAKCNYIKVDGITDKDLNVMRSAPILDVMRLRLELMRLTSLCEKVIKEAGDVR